MTFNVSSANAFNLDEARILSSGNETFPREYWTVKPDLVAQTTASTLDNQVSLVRSQNSFEDGQ